MVKDLTIEETIEIARRRKGLNLWQIASKMDMSLTPLHNRIKGYVPFSKEEITKIAAILGLRKKDLRSM